MEERPVILLGFANDENDFLSHLKAEREGIEDALWNHVSDGIIELQGQVGMTIDKVFSFFKSDHYEKRIKVFHYAGHANSTVWRLEDNIATVAGMASFFANVDLVVLNGCATQQQAAEFIKYGVKAVIASRAEIPDQEAKIFATQFYRNLADGKTLEVSFDTALSKIHAVIGRPAQNQKRSLDIDVPESEVSFFWRLFYANDDMKNWTLAKAGHFDPSYLELEKEEKERKDLEFRLMRFGNFECCRNQILTKLKAAHEVPAGMLVISGDEDSGQKWVAGNLLRDTVSFVGENFKQPLNISFGMETKNDPVYFWQQTREWLGFNRDAVESNLKEDTKFLAVGLIPYLKKQPVIFRIYNDLEASEFTSIVSIIIECFWRPFIAGFSQVISITPETNYYPFVLLIIDESKELDLSTFDSCDLRVQSLSKSPPVTSESIKAWLEWEADNPVLADPVIAPIIDNMTIKYYVGDNNSIILETFFKRICNDLQFQVDDNFSDENRLIYLNKNQDDEFTPDLSLARFFS